MEQNKLEAQTHEQGEPSGTRAEDKSESQARTSYQVRRDWISRATTAGVAESQAVSTSNSTTMQRWLEEPMREQPYNNISAVVEKNHANNTGPATRAGPTRD